MSSPRGLLSLARKLLSLRAKRLEDAPPRRAVSTAYYALFHLLTEAAARLYVRDDSELSAVVRRTFNHESMDAASDLFARGQLPRAIIVPGRAAPIPADLKAVCQAFLDLKAARESADYVFAEEMTREEAVEFVDQAGQAFEAWESVKETDAARLFLASFLLYTKTVCDQSPRGTPKRRTGPTEGNLT